MPKVPLKLALAQVQFAPIHAVAKREVIADFQERIGEQYEAAEREAQQVIEFRIGPGGGPQPPRPSATDAVWPFHDRERPLSVLLSSTSLSLESHEYCDFDEFAAELRSLLDAMSEVFKPRQETRLGLRYINQIEDKRLASQGLGHFLRDELVQPVGSQLGKKLRSSLAELRFQEGDGVLVLRHGLTDPLVYLLDFDRFSEQPQDFEPARISARIVRYHDLIERLFVWSLSERYLRELRKGGRK